MGLHFVQEDSDNEESEEEEPVDLAELFEVIWDGYRQMRTKYFKKAVGPSKVEVIERTMQKLEPQTQRAISFGERRLDVINAELKVQLRNCRIPSSLATSCTQGWSVRCWFCGCVIRRPNQRQKEW